MRKVFVSIAALACLAFAGTTAALAVNPAVVIDGSMSGGYFSGGVAGKGYVQITRVHPNANTGCISMRLRLLGWVMYPSEAGTAVNRPDGGHYHVYVNGKYHSFDSNAVRARACGLETGRTYTLRIVLANNDHSELRARSQVVTVTL